MTEKHFKSQGSGRFDVRSGGSQQPEDEDFLLLCESSVSKMTRARERERAAPQWDGASWVNSRSGRLIRLSLSQKSICQFVTSKLDGSSVTQQSATPLNLMPGQLTPRVHRQSLMRRLSGSAQRSVLNR